MVSQSPQTGQFNSYEDGWYVHVDDERLSQSPQTGQFNSYHPDDLPAISRGFGVSIPSNGSIQFLLRNIVNKRKRNSVSIPSNGSIQFLRIMMCTNNGLSSLLSQSPQTGQFNSYTKEIQDSIQ